ncbi:hypothetical protein NDA15_001952 [Ustilago hordei]|nr:hypothetical protein NDA15_001952 [Ustilago hordei]
MNLTPSATKTIPHEAFYGTTTHKLAQQLQVFGCLAWVHVQWKDQQGKYGARAKPAIMIGYDDEHKAWKFCNPDQPASIQWSNSATFHEDKGWSDHQQEAVWPMVTMEVEEEGATPAIVEEETRSEATVEDLLPAVDSTVGTTNTAVLNLDPTLGEAMNECAPCIYTKGWGEDMAIVVIYIDDTLVIAPWLETVLKVKKQIGQRWKMEDSGKVSHFLSIKISRNCTMCTMTIGQSGYIDQVLAKHLDKCTKPTMVPMQSILEGTLVASAAQQKEYLVIIGKLLWVANSTQPDLSLTMSILTRHMCEPSQEHYQAAQQVLCYLKDTKNVGLVYRGNMSQEPLIAHSDANWASDATIQRRSMSWAWMLKKQEGHRFNRY